MPLETQVIDIPAYKGLNETQDFHTLQPGGLIVANNVVCTRAGALDKRPGFEAMSDELINASGAFPGTWHKLLTVGNELCAIGRRDPDDGGLCTIWSYSSSLDAWALRDDVTPCTVRRYPGTRNSVTQSQGGHVTYGDGLLCHWRVVGNIGLYLRVVDSVTGTVIYNDTLVYAHSGLVVSAFQVGSLSVCVFCAPGGGSFLYSMTYDTSTHVRSSAFTLDAVNIEVFDAAPVEGATDRYALLWQETGVRADVKLAIVDAASETFNVQIAHTVGAPVLALTCAAQAGGRFYGAFYLDGSFDVVVASFNESNLLGLAGPTVISNLVACYNLGAGITSTGECLLLVDGTPGGNPATKRFTITTSAGVVGTTLTAYWLRVLGRPWLAPDGHMYGLFTLQSVGNAPRTHVVCRADATDLFRIAGITVLDSGAPSPLSGTYPTVIASPMGGGAFALASAVLTSTAGNGTSYSYAIDVSVVNFAPPQGALWGVAEAQGCALLTGGSTQSYDGQCVVENGFLMPPVISLAETTTGTGGMAAGESYAYCAAFEWIDAKGNIHTSAPGPISTKTITGAHDAITVTIASLPLTERGQSLDGDLKDVRVHLFRTLDASSGPFYRLTRRGEAPGATGFLLNDRSVPSITYTDKLNDTSLAAIGAGYLYTEGGILATTPAPPSIATTVHKNRVWLISGEDARKIYFSKLLTPTEPPGFNVALYMRIDDSPDEAVALASLDDKLVIFTPSRVYIVTGDGPDDTGANGAFSVPQLITSSVGCSDPRSIVTFSGGVFFQSAQGLYLLDRGGGVTFAGANVQTTISESTTVLASTHNRAAGRLLWLKGGTRRVVVYDYTTDVWSTWTMASAPSALAEWNGTLVYASSDVAPNIRREGQGATPGFDDGAWVVTDVRSPWVRLASVEGFQRARRLTVTARNITPHFLTVELYTNFDQVNPAQSETFDLTTGSGLDAMQNERLQVHLGPAVQKCSALQVRIYDGDPGTTTNRSPAGPVLVSMSLEVGMKRGSAKLPAAQKG